MGLFEGRELEDEFCGIVSELGGDVEGRRKGDQYLLGTHALYHGGPASWALSPKIFDRGQVEVLRDAAETMGAIMNKVTAHYLKDAGFRTLFHLPKSLEDLTLIPSGYDCLIPLARVDVFFDEETGDHQFCELNTDGSAGMTNTVEITRAIQRTASYQRFAERHPRISTFDVVQGAIGAVLETYASWEGAGKGIHPAQGPSMALVDYAESVSADEVDDIIDRLDARGIHARFTDIRDLKMRPVDGQMCLCDAEGRIDCVYRRAVTGEIADKPCDGVEALAEAARQGLVCVVGGFATWPCATKTVFAVLCSDAVKDILTPEELEFVHAHVPYTVLLDPSSDLAPYAEKDRWIVKPAGGYNAQGVRAGLDCTEEEWREALELTARTGGVVQEYARQYRTPVVQGNAPAEGEDPLEFRQASNMEGLYLFRGKFGGVFTRCGYQNVIGEWTHRINMGCIVVR